MLNQDVLLITWGSQRWLGALPIFNKIAKRNKIGVEVSKEEGEVIIPIDMRIITLPDA